MKFKKLYNSIIIDGNNIDIIKTNKPENVPSDLDRDRYWHHIFREIDGEKIEIIYKIKWGFAYFKMKNQWYKFDRIKSKIW